MLRHTSIPMFVFSLFLSSACSTSPPPPAVTPIFAAATETPIVTTTVRSTPIFRQTPELTATPSPAPVFAPLKHPRLTADVNGDGKADVVGFGDIGVVVALSTGSGFDLPQFWIKDFGSAAGAGEWRADNHPRVVADVNGDGRADVIGFGNTGVLVALSAGASFDKSQLWIEDYGYNRDAGAWLIEKHPRGVADVNGDGRADVVGFDDIGVAVALSTGTSFDKSQLWIEEFGYSAGYWR